MDHIEILDETLRSHFSVLYKRQKLRNASASTKSQFRINLDHFDECLGRPATINDLSDDAIADAMQWFLDTGRAPRTGNKFRDNMLALWRFLARKGVVSTWPDVDPLIEPERTPIAWSKEQLATLWQACADQTGTLCGVPADGWWLALHSVAWDTGERISATRSIRLDDIDLRRGFINIRAEYRKGRRKDKLSKLHPDTIYLLAMIMEPARELLFPWPFHSTYLWTKYGSMLTKAGLPADRAHKFHCIRKSAASWFEAAGGDATALLGHSARRVTEKYLDPRVVGQQHASDVLFRPCG